MQQASPFARPGIIASYALALSLIAACGQGDVRVTFTPTDSAIEHHGLKVREVVAETLSTDPAYDRLMRPVLLGNHLWVADVNSAPFFHVIDTATGRLVASLGRAGQGPGEFKYITSFFKSHEGDTTAWAWDSDMGRFTKVSFSILSSSGAAVEVLQPRAALQWTSPRGSNGFLATNPMDENYFTLLSSSGDTIATRPLPLPGDDKVPLAARQEAIDGTSTCPTWDRSGFALVYRNAGRILMFDSLAQTTGAAEVPYPQAEVFVPHPRTRELIVDESRKYYYGCVFSHDRLFALFSGKLIPKTRGSEPTGESRFVHVFDMKGKLLEVLRLSATVGSITVDSLGSRLFGVSTQNPIVYRFRLR